MVNITRKIVQFIFAIVTNLNFKGFIEGKIYRGPLKKLCVPGLNCYSCPGALGSCPIGSLQAVIGSLNYKLSFYLFGILMFFGTVLGRFICGWLCPFGLIQELLYKIPSPKIKIPRVLSKVKYVVLLVFVIILPMFITDSVGIGDPTFCKYICPAGTLEAGIPLVSMNGSLQASIGFLFFFKISILIVTLILSILIFRPFCKVICPLGAIYAFFNKISFYRYYVDEHKCTKCGICIKACKMNIEPYKSPNDTECIRCRDCITACPHTAISSSFNLKDPKQNI